MAMLHDLDRRDRGGACIVSHTSWVGLGWVKQTSDWFFESSPHELKGSCHPFAGKLYIILCI